VGMAKRVQLRGEFKWDNSRLKRGLAESEAVIKRTAGKVKGAIGKVAGIGGLAGAFSIGSALKDFDRIGKLATQFDLPVQFLQRMKLASELSGAELESVAKAMKRMILNAQEAERGVESYAVAFENLGLNAAEYVKLTPDEQFMRLADAVKNSTDPMRTHAAILRLMGTRGSELIPLLKEGRAGIEGMTDGMRILSDEGVRSIEAANDAWTKMITNIKTGVAEGITGIGSLWTTMGDLGLTYAAAAAKLMGDDLLASMFMDDTSESERARRQRGSAMRSAAARAASGATKGMDDAPRPKIRMPWLRQQTRADKFMSGLGVQFAGLDAMVNMQKTSGNFRGRLNDPVFGQNAASIRAASADAWVARNKKKDEDNLKTIADNTQRTAAVLESL